MPGPEVGFPRRVNTNVTQETVEAIHKLARQRETTMSTVVRQLIVEGLARQ